MASDALEIVAGSSLVIAVGLAMMGYWPMPFAGMEILLLAWALTRPCQAQWRMVISVNTDVVEIERERSGEQDRYRVRRSWAWVRLLPLHYRLHQNRLAFRSYGIDIEVGDFLIEEERLSPEQKLRWAISAPKLLGLSQN